MSRITLIQFLPETELLSNWGFYPNINEIYKVRTLDDEYEIEEGEDDDGETIIRTEEAMSIYLKRYGKFYGSARYILKENVLKYNLITIELEDNCQLFK